MDLSGIFDTKGIGGGVKDLLHSDALMGFSGTEATPYGPQAGSQDNSGLSQNAHKVDGLGSLASTLIKMWVGGAAGAAGGAATGTGGSLASGASAGANALGMGGGLSGMGTSFLNSSAAGLGGMVDNIASLPGNIGSSLSQLAANPMDALSSIPGELASQLASPLAGYSDRFDGYTGQARTGIDNFMGLNQVAQQPQVIQPRTIQGLQGLNSGGLATLNSNNLSRRR